MNSYPHESIDHQPVTVTFDGAPITSGFTLCDVPEGVWPVTFISPVLENGKWGVIVGGYLPGVRRVWAKVGTVVIDCGPYLVT